MNMLIVHTLMLEAKLEIF